MNIKMIKRAGLVFVIFPIHFICMILNIAYWIAGIIWCPIYYIITGKDPINEEMAIFWNLGEFIWNWYIKITGI
jgi:hypothetical protein